MLKRLKALNIILDISDEVKMFLIEHGYDEKYGARPLRRAVERHIEDPLAEAILQDKIKRDGTPVKVVVKDDALDFVQELPAEAS